VQHCTDLENLEMFADSVANMPVEEVLKKEQELIGNHPNTYMFTKNIAEQLMKKNRRNIPMTIVRPSIVGAAIKEPFPGWVDSVSSATAVY
jgi:fatty acyl-CoA reductase